MAQTGYTPILIYSSSTASNAPAAGNLTNSTLGSELAINITDGKLFYKDNANAIQVIGWKVTPTSAGGTGLTSYAAGDLLFYASGTALSKLAIGANTTVLTSSGSAPQWTAQSSLAVGTASNLKSNTTTGVMQIVGPAAAATRVMTIPDANFTAARTDAGQTFTGNQIFTLAGNDANIKVQNSGGGAAGAWYFADSVDLNYMGFVLQSAGVEKWFSGSYATAAYQIKNGGRSGTEALRIETSNDVKVSAGNLVIGTSGKGIDFSATSGTGTSELLADYEEGTWTPTDGSGASLTFAAGTAGIYTKIGRVVYVSASVRYPVTANGNNAQINGLPFAMAGSPDGAQGGMVLTYSASATPLLFKPNNGSTEIIPRSVANGTHQTNANMSNTRYDFAGFYIV